MPLSVDERKRRQAARVKKWDEAHREERAAYKHEWYLKNKEKCLAHNAAYQKAHREQINARQRERYRADPEYREKRLRAYKAWLAKNPEKAAECQRRYYQKRLKEALRPKP